MIAHQVQQGLYYRLASYYLGKLQNAEAVYQLGQAHSDFALGLFDQEWSQIKRWWDWTIVHSHDNQMIAQLCKDYSRSGGDLLALRQHPRERLELLTTGLDVARQLQDTHAEMVHLYLLGNTYMVSGLSNSARTFAEQAVSLAQQIDDPLYLMRSLLLLGDTLYLLDEYHHSKITHQQALGLSEELDTKKEMGIILNGLGNVAMSQNDYPEALEYFTQSLKMSEIYGQPTEVCIALHNLCAVASRLNDYPTAVLYGERCVTLCRTIHYDYCLADVMIELGSLSTEHGNFPEALRYYQESLEISRRIHHLSNEACALGRLGHLHCLLGDLATSVTYLEASLSRSTEIGSRWYIAIALRYMVAVYRITHEPHTALSKLREGLEIACTIESPVMWARYLLEAALLWPIERARDQTALWLGLLEGYLSQLTQHDRTLYFQLSEAVMTEVGPVLFAAAAEQGKKSDLNVIMQQILSDLSTLPS